MFALQLTLEGIFPPHITPFMKNEEIDETGLRSLIHFWLDSGCAGLVSCASNGEGPYMTREERRRVLHLVIDEVNGKVPVIAGAGAPSTRETAFLTRDAADTGADAVLIVSPYYFKPDSRELFEHYSSVIGSTDIPVIVYNVPKFTGYNVDPDVVVRLAEEYDQVVGVKDSGGSIGQISDLIRRIGGRISVLAGTADLVLPCLLMGGRGAVVGIANVAPRLCVDLYNHFKQNEIERAREVQMKLLGVNDILVKKFDQISAIKEAMNQLGKPAGYPRRPSLPLEEKARNEVRERLAELGID
jgi:4-hydroxy-tetrahydrodipicolinate synthase